MDGMDTILCHHLCTQNQTVESIHRQMKGFKVVYHMTAMLLGGNILAGDDSYIVVMFKSTQLIALTVKCCNNCTIVAFTALY